MSKAPYQQSALRYQLLAWQGWQLRVPDDWNPVKVDGDADQGQLLLADLERPRLGLRWRRLSKRVDAEKWTRQSVKEEVGELAASEARPLDIPGSENGAPAGKSAERAWQANLLYAEPQPPGRDVWAGVSTATGRGLQVVFHVKKRDRQFADEILPALQDTPADAQRPWAIFDLNCQSPPGWAVQWYRFYAGDLALSFANGRGRVMIRQVGPAGLALSRQPLETWLKQQDKTVAKLYRPVGEPVVAEVTLRGQSIQALRSAMRKRRRLFWAVTIRDQLRLAVHDAGRNRLIIAQGDDETVVRQFLDAVGQGSES